MKHGESEESHLLDRVMCWFMDLKKKILCSYKISSPAASSSSGVHPLLRCPFLKVLVFSAKMLQSIQMRCLAHSSLRLCFCLWALLFHFDLLSHFLNRSSYDSCYVWRVSEVAALSTLQLKGFLLFVPCICSISDNYWDVLTVKDVIFVSFSLISELASYNLLLCAGVSPVHLGIACRLGTVSCYRVLPLWSWSLGPVFV